MRVYCPLYLRATFQSDRVYFQRSKAFHVVLFSRLSATLLTDRLFPHGEQFLDSPQASLEFAPPLFVAVISFLLQPLASPDPPVWFPLSPHLWKNLLR